MRCPYCSGEAERMTFFEDPLPGIAGDQIKTTVVICWTCGLVDREAEMIVALIDG